MCWPQVGLITGRTRPADAPALLRDYAEHERTTRCTGQGATDAPEWTRFTEISGRGTGRSTYRDHRVREHELNEAFDVRSVYSPRARSSGARDVLN